MGLFNKILNKLGIKKDKAEDSNAKPVAPASIRKPQAKPASSPAVPFAAKQAMANAAAKDAVSKKAVSKEISEVDVVKQLETLGAGKGLNWKVSIVDLLTLLDIDSSREARNELATELGCPPEFMKDSAKMNTWLHKTVLKKIAENGGNIPKDLLD